MEAGDRDPYQFIMDQWSMIFAARKPKKAARKKKAKAAE